MFDCKEEFINRVLLFTLNGKILENFPHPLVAQFTGAKSDANIILYDYEHLVPGNWAGIGADPNGRFIIFFGLSEGDRHSYVFTSEGIFLDNRKITT